MMIWTTKFSHKKAFFAVIGMGIVMVILILLTNRVTEEAENTPPLLENNEARVSYIRELGWEVEEEPVESLRILLPDPLEEPYISYNDLQVLEGFDLVPCAGKEIFRYTYVITNYPSRAQGVQLNLYVCENKPVAGDIFCAGADGFQEMLIRKEE